jgi:hypothetical protein
MGVSVKWVEVREDADGCILAVSGRTTIRRFEAAFRV